MPMYFGYQAHRDHGAPWRQPRSGRQMQQDPGYAARWDRRKREAHSNAELFRLMDAARGAGWTSREIVDVFDADLDGDIAEIRRRKAALDRSRG
jgi:hypothetical protein